MESAKWNTLGIRLDEDYNAYDFFNLTKADGLTDSQYRKLCVLKDIVTEYNSFIPIDKRYKITGPNDAAALLYMVLKGKSFEECWALYLNNAGRVLRRMKLTSGGLTQTLFDVQTVLRNAIYLNATGIIIAHNHPSGDPKPSKADITATENLQKAASCIGIRLQDHIIISDSCYYSFIEKCNNAYDEALVKKLLL